MFDEINFGDGTGFYTTSGVPIDIHHERPSNSPCVTGRTDVASATPKSPPNLLPDDRSQLRASPLPAGNLPVNFSPGKAGRSRATATSSHRDVCCPGQSGCSRRKPDTYTCCFGDAKTTQSASCNEGVCGDGYELDRGGVCDEFGTRCPEFYTDACPPLEFQFCDMGYTWSFSQSCCMSGSTGFCEGQESLTMLSSSAVALIKVRRMRS